MKPLIALLLLLSCLPSKAAPPPDDLQLFLLIGQSNMAGRGKVESQDEVTSSQIFMLTKENQWAPSKDPVHFDKPIAGVGLCSQFARELLKADPAIKVGLIPCAVGGTSLDEWKPGAKLYLNAMERAREAMKHGKLAGILWHQGEADSAPDKVATYSERFAVLISQLRRELGAPQVPVVMGELGRFRPESAAYNANLPEVSRAVPYCAYVTAENLNDKGDKLHFDAPALRTFGQRYATAFLKLKEVSR